MSEKSIEKMKELIEKKHAKSEQKSKFIPKKKMGSSHKEFNTQKNAGSNNKV